MSIVKHPSSHRGGGVKRAAFVLEHYADQAELIVLPPDNSIPCSRPTSVTPAG